MRIDRNAREEDGILHPREVYADLDVSNMDRLRERPIRRG